MYADEYNDWLPPGDATIGSIYGLMTPVPIYNRGFTAGNGCPITLRLIYPCLPPYSTGAGSDPGGTNFCSQRFHLSGLFKPFPKQYPNRLSLKTPPSTRGSLSPNKPEGVGLMRLRGSFEHLSAVSDSQSLSAKWHSQRPPAVWQNTQGHLMDR